MPRPARPLQPTVEVRDAQPGEFGRIGELRVAAYQSDGFLSAASGYADTLRVLGMDGTGEILAAVDNGHILGTVTLVTWPHGGEVLRHPGEGEVRALAVAASARGRGIGRALLAAVLRRATIREVRQLLLLTQPDMHAAQHLYGEAGFRRLPHRDYEYTPGHHLLAFGVPLTQAESHPEGKRWAKPLSPDGGQA
jgi:ribosomal protein S18 acetylase RimI-like enzyme